MTYKEIVDFLKTLYSNNSKIVYISILYCKLHVTTYINEKNKKLYSFLIQNTYLLSFEIKMIHSVCHKW